MKFNTNTITLYKEELIVITPFSFNLSISFTFVFSEKHIQTQMSIFVYYKPMKYNMPFQFYQFTISNFKYKTTELN